MKPDLSLEELAERTGEPVTRLREWRILELIGSGDGERFVHDDIERVRLFQMFLRRGFDLRTIAKATRSPVFSRSLAGYVERFASVRAGRAGGGCGHVGRGRDDPAKIPRSARRVGRILRRERVQVHERVGARSRRVSPKRPSCSFYGCTRTRSDA